MSADLYAAFLEGGDGKGPSGNASQATSVETTRTGGPGRELDSQTIPSSRVTQLWSNPAIQKSSLWQKDAGGSGTDVLFDADQPESDDDFGDFEAVGDVNDSGIEPTQVSSNTHPERQTGRAPTTANLVADLLDTDGYLHHASNSAEPLSSGRALDAKQNIPPAEAISTDRTGKVDDTWGEDWGDLEQTQPQTEPGYGSARTEQHGNVTVPGRESSKAEEDEWEPFEDGEPACNAQAALKDVSTILQKGSQTPSSSLPNHPSFHERPTNVPPPSSLLQLLSDVFKALHQCNIDNKVPKSDLAAKIVIVFRTACRLVAGRSLRWRRDTLLSQSMRISQAGKSGGMKLTSINKSESAKEERDCKEMIRDWDLHLHEFNDIIARAGLQPHRMKIPSSAVLKTLKYPGSTESSKQCALCGLKRNERVVEVDVDNDDLFGEFWTEHWGHKDCYEFWYSYNGLLGHR